MGTNRDRLRIAGRLSGNRCAQRGVGPHDRPAYKKRAPGLAFKSSFHLNDGLSAMGMSDPLDPERADFSGIGGIPCPQMRCLYAGVAAHEALNEVNEEATIAVAATAVESVEKVSRGGPPQTPRVRIDRPFISLIRDIPETGGLDL